MNTSYKTLVRTKSKRPAIAKLRHQVLKHFQKGGQGKAPYLTAGDKQIEIPVGVLLDEAKWMAFIKRASDDYQASLTSPAGEGEGETASGEQDE